MAKIATAPLPFRSTLPARDLEYIVTYLSLPRSAWPKLVACLWLAAFAARVGADESLEPIADFGAMAQPLLTNYCSDCHSGPEPESEMAVEELRGGDDFQQDRRMWINILRRLRAGDMPPVDMPQPTDDERLQLVEWVAAKLDSVDCSGQVNPGRVTLRRLNREQYRNTVRDLLGVRYDASDLFPPDELAYGFDNNGDVLSISPLLFEKYLTAAAAVAREAVPTAEEHKDRGDEIKLSRTDGVDQEARMLFTSGKFVGRFKPKRDGRYAMRVEVTGMQAGDDPVRMELWLDDRRLKQVDVWSDNDEQETFVALFDAKKDQRVELGVAFINDFYNEQLPEGSKRDRNLIIHEMRVVGPLRLSESAPKTARTLLLDSLPKPEAWQNNNGWEPVARDRLRALVPRAYRREADEDDIDRLMEVMKSSRANGDSYERALQLTVQAVLMSPQFLFVGDLTPVAENEGIRPISEFALASRLSYFLWGSMPDDELLALADRGMLRDELDSQVRRMLRDGRIRNLATNFAGQWLETRQLASIRPDPQKFPEFDDNLRDAMIREAEEFFEAVVVEDLPIGTLLDANFVYVNDRLAQHYGIDGIEGNYFRKVSLSEDQRAAGRGGLLGLASVLTVTSSPDRTSPVLRGKFVLANLLGDEPPPPPPNVPTLPEGDGQAITGTVRQRLEAHRSDPSCASCHSQIDPLGFALEGFDALGRTRSEEDGQPIDDAGALPDGTNIKGANGLRELLVSREEEFRKALAEKLLTYALGRGLEYYDQCALREIIAATEANDDQFSALVMAIVQSRPFLLENCEQPKTLDLPEKEPKL